MHGFVSRPGRIALGAQEVAANADLQRVLIGILAIKRRTMWQPSPKVIVDLGVWSSNFSSAVAIIFVNKLLMRKQSEGGFNFQYGAEAGPFEQSHRPDQIICSSTLAHLIAFGTPARGTKNISICQQNCFRCRTGVHTIITSASVAHNA